MRIALALSYDGRGFSGWQTQPSGLAVQDAVEPAIAAIAGHPVRTICAGRTDTGVHATAQLLHFDTDSRRPEQAWVRGVNAALPPGVAVHWAREVPGDFHARFSARARTYRYLLLQAPVRAPLWEGRAGWTFRPLDADRMREGAVHLLGEHDFSAFRSAECQAASPVRTLHRLDIEARGHGLLVLTLQANAFLHHMVRNLVGSLVAVGSGARPAAWMGELLAGRDRRVAAATFSPAGLYLCDVDYPERFGLPATGLPLPGVDH